ncbi:type II toxin-antitoxin system VapC family toxin [Acidiphilium sp.]|uniref:type II toxin-antitoxin system VapC family toxin n=1 Tax=Acidiphilium sp. TaxID=527 RepID=UPI003D072C30
MIPSILIRYLTADHPIQSPKARKLIENGPVFVATTVLLEAEWVLRGVYAYAPDSVIEALTRFAGLPTVRLQDPKLAAKALRWTRHGLEFADALHLSTTEGCTGFVSFDRNLVRLAQGLHEIAVETP